MATGSRTSSRAQHLSPLDVARFSTGPILASALPFSTIYDGRWIDRQLGAERARTSFPFRMLLDAGAVVSFGSGWLDRGSPIDGIYAAVTRRTLDGLHPQGWIPAQRLTVEEALRVYTLQVISTLPEGFAETSYCADIHVSRDGRFVYGSNRGHDSIVIFAVDDGSGKLSLVDYESTQGEFPRNFALDLSGHFLFAANQNTNNIVVYRVDAETGKLRPTGHQIEVPQPVCITMIPAP